MEIMQRPVISETYLCGDAEMHLSAWPVFDLSSPAATLANTVFVAARFLGAEERTSVEETLWSLHVPGFVLGTEEGRRLSRNVLSSLDSLTRDGSWRPKLPYMEQEVFGFADRAAHFAADYYRTDGCGRCGGIQVLVDVGYRRFAVENDREGVNDVESVGSNDFVEERDDDGFEVESARSSKATGEEVGVEGSSAGYVAMFYENRGLDTMLEY